MAKIASKIMFFSTVSDAARYRIRIIPDDEGFDYSKPPTLTVDQPSPVTPEVDVDLAGVSLSEGTYDIFITAEDAGGNESDPLELADAVLDFTPPAAPAAGGFRS